MAKILFDHSKLALHFVEGWEKYEPKGMTKKDVKAELTLIGFPKPVIKEFWSSVDPNEEGRISLAVFKGALILLYRAPRPAKARFLFRCFDDKKEGVISKKQCKKMFFTLYWTGYKLVDSFAPLPIGTGLVGRIMVKNFAKKAADGCDADGDGRVSEQDLVDWMKKEQLPDWAIALQDEIDKAIDKDCPDLPDEIKAQFLLPGETLDDVSAGRPRGGGVKEFGEKKVEETKTALQETKRTAQDLGSAAKNIGGSFIAGFKK